MLVLAWTPSEGRARELAAAFDGEGRCFFDLGAVHPVLIPLRYLISAVRTLWTLVALRPAAVIVQSPPVFPGLIAWLYARVTGAVVVLDTHPQALDVDPTRAISAFMPLQRWLVPRVSACLVAVDELAVRVRQWGGRALVLHEAPPLWEVAPPRAVQDRPRVLFVGIFAPDEPVDAVVAAAELVPDVDVHITGDRRLCPAPLMASAPGNVAFTGFLRDDAFRQALEEADIIMSLTTREEAVNRAAYEAVAAQRPLIVSDRPVGRQLFPHAVHTANEADAIAAAIRLAVGHHAELVALTAAALTEQQERWRAQSQSLGAVLAGGPERP